MTETVFAKEYYSDSFQRHEYVVVGWGWCCVQVRRKVIDDHSA
jgi:hypothetical protein